MLSKRSRAKQAESSGAERRRELRQATDGAVRMRQPGLLATAFDGRLLDTAPTGFRARHGQLALVSGEVVDFEFEGRKGSARAIWTRIVNGHAETGFRILPQDSD